MYLTIFESEEKQAARFDCFLCGTHRAAVDYVKVEQGDSGSGTAL